MFTSQVPELQAWATPRIFGADVPRLRCRRSGRECKGRGPDDRKKQWHLIM